MPADLASLRQEFRLRMDAGDLDGALAATNAIIALDGSTEQRLEWKHRLLRDLGRLDEALDAAIECERASRRKSPFGYLRIAEAHLALGHLEEAMAWAERAVAERRFRLLRLFQRPPLDVLQRHPRFAHLERGIAMNTGIGAPLNDFTVDLVTGRALRLSDLRGSIVLVDVWSTDCPPCVAEVPHLRRTYEQHRAAGFEILAISLDTDLDVLRAFLAEHKISWLTACSGRGWSDKTVELLDVHSTPSMWLLDRQGVVSAFDVRGEDLQLAVSKLLAED